MRQLLPPAVSFAEAEAEVDLAAAYAYPTEGTWVRANMVASVDGASRLEGRSGGLSNPADMRLFGLIRQLSDVILVGAQTARIEEYGPVPMRDAYAESRRLAGQLPTPGFALISGSLDLDPDASIFRDATTRTLVITCESAPVERRERLLLNADVLDAGDTRVDVSAAVDALIARGHRRISCEGGPRVLAQLAAAGRLDELCLTTSPLLAGGAAPRILDGDAVAPPYAMTLAGLLEDGGSLFARYVRAASSTHRS